MTTIIKRFDADEFRGLGSPDCTAIGNEKFSQLHNTPIREE